MEDQPFEHPGVFMRLNEHEGYEDQIKKFAEKEEYTHVLGAHHKGSKGENSHWHFIISTNQTIDAVRKRVKLFFNKGKGNGHCSIVAWDGKLPGAGSYLFHEEVTKIVIQKNITEDDVQVCKKHNERIQTLVKEAKDKASFKLVDKVLDRLRDLEPSEREYSWTKLNIREVMIDVLFDSQIHPPTNWQFDSYCNEILLKLYVPVGDKEGFKNQFRQIYRV